MIKSAELENSAYEFEAKMPLRHAGFMRNMKSPRKQRRISFINSVRTRTIFEDTVFAGMKSG